MRIIRNQECLLWAKMVQESFMELGLNLRGWTHFKPAGSRTFLLFPLPRTSFFRCLVLSYYSEVLDCHHFTDNFFNCHV